MTLAYVGLGSNLGDRVGWLRVGVEGLSRTTPARLVAVSPIFETDPVGGPEQDDYLNAVLALEWTRTPAELLERLLEIERETGRVRRERHGPRTLDLDLLLFGDEVIEQKALVVPHPRMAQRGFVLEPLRRLAAGLLHPVLGETIEVLAERVRDDERVRPFADSSQLVR
jgi:2-amino-4-hydroxy-6-hydroxymethyldihydropteridine diphosphokinase